MNIDPAIKPSDLSGALDRLFGLAAMKVKGLDHS